MSEIFDEGIEREIEQEVTQLSPTIIAKLSELELEVVKSGVLFRRAATLAINTDRSGLSSMRREQIEQTIRMAEVALIETKQLLAQMEGYRRLDRRERAEVESKFQVMFGAS